MSGRPLFMAILADVMSNLQGSLFSVRSLFFFIYLFNSFIYFFILFIYILTSMVFLNLRAFKEIEIKKTLLPFNERTNEQKKIKAKAKKKIDCSN